ncbi:hypothetical protein IWQ54_001563 [Labrenzia sp. EL_195]|nr:hypothetical protein [Labrenzia sp. EL_195]MCR9056399.1 hypothetical protein [Paracoccaceae bacterium]
MVTRSHSPGCLRSKWFTTLTGLAWTWPCAAQRSAAHHVMTVSHRLFTRVVVSSFTNQIGFRIAA